MRATGIPVEYEADTVARNSGLVGAQLKRFQTLHFLGGLTLDDLRSVGMAALLQSVRTFNVNRGHSFSTFAIYRIRGAMLDAIRSADTIPRTVRRRKTAIIRASQRLRAMLVRRPAESEIALELGVETATLVRWRLDIDRYESLAVDHDDPDPDPATIANDTLTLLYSAMRTLNERPREIIFRRYWLNQRSGDIARELGEPRQVVYDVERRALQRLRRVMRERKTGLG